MPLSYLPAVLSAWFAQLVGTLDRRSAPRLRLLLEGALFARGRRTVTSWFRAAGITGDFRRAYNALWAAGRQAHALGHRLLQTVLVPLMHKPPETTCCSRWTTRPPRVTARASRERACITTPLPDRRASAFSTATSG